MWQTAMVATKAHSTGATVVGGLWEGHVQHFDQCLDTFLSGTHSLTLAAG